MKKPLNIIVEIKYGSHLYGTATPQSDCDIKGIYMPTAREILLQRIQPVLVEKTNIMSGTKNSPQDIDYELYSPERFLQSVAKGQSFALEMIFAPDSALLNEPHPLWYAIKKIGKQLITKQATSIVNYCKQQAYKYCQKGSRLAGARATRTLLLQAEKEHGSAAPLHSIYNQLLTLTRTYPDIKLSEEQQLNGPVLLSLHVCGKKAMLNAGIKNARILVENCITAYGQRAQCAERNDGADLKALSHAVRIAHQALEFLTSCNLTFPRPEREHLRAIRAGKIPVDLIFQEIEDLLVKVLQAEHLSPLAQTHNQKILDDFIEQLYRDEVIKYKNH